MARRKKNTNTPVKKQENLVVNQVIIKAPLRKTSDVSEWRNALSGADNGHINRLYDLYEDLLIDGILGDAMDKRIGAVTNSELTFVDAKGKEVEAITDIIDTAAMEELITQIMHVRFWGRAAVEFDFMNGFNVYELPKKHINLNKKIIQLDAFNESGFDYEADDNILVLGKKRDFGLFLKTAPFAIYKRGGFGDYAQWLELFGMPQRIGKYNSYDTESRRLLEQAMENAGSAPYLVVPKEAEIETINNTGNGNSGQSFNDFRKACNEELLITILGQTLTSIQGDKGARSLGEVHKLVEEGKNKSDIRFVQRILNGKVLPILEKRGFPVSGGRFVFPKATKDLEVSEVVSLSEILDIPAYYLYEKYAIPEPSANDQIAGKQALPKGEDNNPPQDPKQPKDKKEEKIEQSDSSSLERSVEADRNFLIRLWDFFAYAPTLMGAASNHLTLNDADLNDRIIGRIDGSTSFDIELFDYISQNLLKALDDKPTRLADLGFTYQYQSDAFRTAQELNIFQFSAAKSLEEITQLNQLYRESKSFEEFYKKSTELCNKFNKVWQQTEYASATNTSSAAETYNRLKKKSHIFPYWEYRTVDDGRVRPEHVKLHGLILPANDPRWNKIFPPNGWKCRCYIVPKLGAEIEGVDLKEMRKRADEYLESGEWEKVDKQGFGINRALLPELFRANQMYINKFPTRAGKLLSSINYQTYRLGSYKQNRALAESNALRYEGTLENFVDSLPKENELSYFTDYNNRKVTFDLELWKKGHKPNKVKQRSPFIKSAKETLLNPDEVWITTSSNNFNEYAFIKYYNDVSIVAIAEVKEGTVYRLKTWFPVAENKVTKRYRSGVLIKKGGN